jgi:hypothetical protein
LPLERLGREHAAKAAADHQDFLFLHGCPAFLPAAIPTPMLHCVKSRQVQGIKPPSAIDLRYSASDFCYLALALLNLWRLV